ncbi:hypothetical protein AVEN_179506-1 [Araneus ventricosus]|uniref:Uncharacterized protein n=1 Tax=Araneus ventricosus TaxID=182803 RepID=A0A4Y2IWZ9_ARAVE|nr:hypothetical protein AVEN_179506-1 [Araneus ventricosus]
MTNPVTKRVFNDVEEHDMELCPDSAVLWGCLLERGKNTAHKYTKCCHDGKVQAAHFLMHSRKQTEIAMLKLSTANSGIRFCLILFDLAQIKTTTWNVYAYRFVSRCTSGFP